MRIELILIMSIFIVLIVVSNSVLAWLGSSTANTSTQSVVSELRDDVDSRVVNQFQILMQGPIVAVQRTALESRMGWVDITNRAVLTLLYGNMASWPFTAHYIGTEQNLTFMIKVNDTNSAVFTYEYQQVTDPVSYYFQWDRNKSPLEFFLGTDKGTPSAYYPTIRPWYIEQKSNQSSARYSAVYYFATGDYPGITATAPCFDATGAFIGVAAADLLLDFIDTLVKQIASEVAQNTVTYIVEPTGLLVAVSQGAAGAADQRFLAVNHPVTVISSSASTIGDFSTITTIQRSSQTIAGSDYWVDVVPLTIYNLNWYFVLVILQSDYLSGVNKSSAQMTTIACVICVLTFLLAVATIVFVLRTIRTMSSRVMGDAIGAGVSLHDYFKISNPKPVV